MDLQILEWIRNVVAHPILDVLFKSITLLGDHGLVWILIALYFLIGRKTRWFALILAGVLLVELGLVEYCIKLLVNRERPYLAAGVDIIIAHPSGSSFPSGHTASSFAAATYLFGRDRKQGTLALILAALIGLSRMYLFVHYPSDVLAGALLGIALGWLGYCVYKKWFLRKEFVN